MLRREYLWKAERPWRWLIGVYRDLCWALLMMRARRYRRRLGFSSRIAFDKEFRTILWHGARIDYPDAFYHSGAKDFQRARWIAEAMKCL